MKFMSFTQTPVGIESKSFEKNFNLFRFSYQYCHQALDQANHHQASLCNIILFSGLNE